MRIVWFDDAKCLHKLNIFWMMNTVYANCKWYSLKFGSVRLTLFSFETQSIRFSPAHEWLPCWFSHRTIDDVQKKLVSLYKQNYSTSFVRRYFVNCCLLSHSLALTQFVDWFVNCIKIRELLNSSMLIKGMETNQKICLFPLQSICDAMVNVNI